MDPVKVYTGVRGGLSPLLLISLILSCGCMQGSGTGHDDVVWTETLDCRGNESEIELVQIALRDEQVVDAVSNHSFETEIAVSNLNWGEVSQKRFLSCGSGYLMAHIARMENMWVSIRSPSMIRNRSFSALGTTRLDIHPVSPSR